MYDLGASLFSTALMQHFAGMNRRPAHAYLLAVGRAIAAARKARGITVQQFADVLAIDLRNAHQLEAGTQNLSVLRLQRVAEALASTPAALLASAESIGMALEQVARSSTNSALSEPPWSRELRALGWRPLDSGSRGKGVPVWSLLSSEASDVATAIPHAVGYVRAPGRHEVAGMALAQAVGADLAGLPEGAWCLVATADQQPRVRGIMLVCVPAAEHAGGRRWQFRRIGAVQCDGEDGLQLRLDSSDSAAPPQWVKLPDDGNTAPRAVGQVVKVLGDGLRS